MKIVVVPESRLGRFCTTLMNPLMRWLAGNGAEDEYPQQTHRWNYQELELEGGELEWDRMVYVCGMPTAKSSHVWRIPRLHMRRFGGWEDFVVLSPQNVQRSWYAGWITESSAGISRISLCGSVRMLIGSQDVSFFGVDAGTCEQVTLKRVGIGMLGDGGPYTDIPLL